MQKQLILLVALFFIGYLNAQKATFSFELVELNGLYTGYPHLLKVQNCGNVKGAFTLIGENVKIEEKGKGYYIVTPGEGLKATIYVVQQKKNAVDTLSSKTFRINPLPPTTLFLGNAVSGSSITEPGNRLMGKYTSDVPLNASHLVVSWKLIYGDDVVMGQGSVLSAEAEKYIETLPKGAYFVLECVVWMQDRTSKTAYGVWRKDYGED